MELTAASLFGLPGGTRDGLYWVRAGRWGEITSLNGSSGPVGTCCNGSSESVLTPHSERLRLSGSDADVWFIGVAHGDF